MGDFESLTAGVIIKSKKLEFNIMTLPALMDLGSGSHLS